MTSIIVICLISLLMDGLLTNYLPYLVNDLTLFTPMFTVIVVFLIYPLFYKENKKYLIGVFILGCVYDLFYTNLVFFDGLIFLLLGFITIFIYKTFDVTSIRVFIHLTLTIILYESFFAGLIKLFNLVPMSFDRLLFKISHSILLNLIYGFILYLIIRKIVKRKASYKIYKVK